MYFALAVNREEFFFKSNWTGAETLPLLRAWLLAVRRAWGLTRGTISRVHLPAAPE
jgi:hypothetical protein